MSEAHDYLANSYNIARMSKDSSNQLGATLVSATGEIIGTGVNNFAIGVDFTTERAETRPDKYRYFEHAERSSIYQAARAGVKVYGATMYCPWSACCDCARGIINSGVLRLVMHTQRMSMTPPRWKDDVNEALQMMDDAGVTLEYFDGPITGCPDVIVNGELWSPAAEAVEAGEGNYFVGMGV